MKDLNQYLHNFAEKHDTQFERFVDPEEEIAKFSNGMFFHIDDILFDIDKEVPKWAAKQYHEQGTEGALSEGYIQWFSKFIPEK